jgi:hypothetical protein
VVDGKGKRMGHFPQAKITVSCGMLREKIMRRRKMDD